MTSKVCVCVCKINSGNSLKSKGFKVIAKIVFKWYDWYKFYFVKFVWASKKIKSTVQRPGSSVIRAFLWRARDDNFCARLRHAKRWNISVDAGLFCYCYQKYTYTIFNSIYRTIDLNWLDTNQWKCLLIPNTREVFF